MTVIIVTIMSIAAVVEIYNRHRDNAALDAALAAYEVAEAAEAAEWADREEFVRQYRHAHWRYNLHHNLPNNYTEEQIDIIISQMEKEWQEALPSFSESE